VLPFTFGEELVSNDPTALLETGFELIGMPLVSILGLSLAGKPLRLSY